jgi:hypothetical protein
MWTCTLGRIQRGTYKRVVIDLDETSVEIGRTVTWRAKDADYSVKIVGDLAIGSDGRRYVSVQNASTGVPFDELDL